MAGAPVPGHPAGLGAPDWMSKHRHYPSAAEAALPAEIPPVLPSAMSVKCSLLEWICYGVLSVYSW